MRIHTVHYCYDIQTALFVKTHFPISCPVSVVVYIHFTPSLTHSPTLVPKHRFRERLRKEDVDKCHDFIEQILQGAGADLRPGTSIPERGSSKKKQVASFSVKTGNLKAPKNNEKGKKAAATVDMGKKQGKAAEAEAKLMAEAREKKKHAKKEKEEKRAKKAARKVAKEDKAVKAMEERQRLERIAEQEEEKKRKSGFLPRIGMFGGSRKKGSGDSDDEEEQQSLADEARLRKEEEEGALMKAELADGSG